MLSDLDAFDGDITAETEVCIIGGGPAGITVALELGKAGHDVLLLESGGTEFDAESQALAEGSLTGRPFAGDEGLDAVRLRLLGGTSGHWAGYCRPFEPMLFGGQRDYLGVTDWPFDRSTLVPWWEVAAEYVGLVPGEHDWRWWDERALTGAAVISTERVETPVYQIRGRRFGTHFREELTKSSKVNVMLHATATELVTNESDRAVEMVRARNLAGTELTVSAQLVILATGGVEIPRLLLASNARRPAGIGNEHDLVGRNFMEHPQAVGAIAVLEGEPDRWRQLRETQIPDASDLPAEIKTKGFITPTDATTIADQRMAFEAQATIGRIDRTPAPARGLGAQHAAGLRRLEGASPQTSIIFQALTEQEPNPASRVTIGRELDAVGLPEVRLDWQLTDRDLENLSWGFRRLGAEFGRLGEGILQVALDDVTFSDSQARHDNAIGMTERFDVTQDPDDTELTVSHANHHMGTTRMATDPSEGVVNAQCRVHSVENLFVAGSSVFPVAGAAPPTFNLVALAARLADHLHTDVLK